MTSAVRALQATYSVINIATDLTIGLYPELDELIPCSWSLCPLLGMMMLYNRNDL